jgi:hypothetical protein
MSCVKACSAASAVVPSGVAALGQQAVGRFRYVVVKLNDRTGLSVATLLPL